MGVGPTEQLFSRLVKVVQLLQYLGYPLVVLNTVCHVDIHLLVDIICIYKKRFRLDQSKFVYDFLFSGILS